MRRRLMLLWAAAATTAAAVDAPPYDESADAHAAIRAALDAARAGPRRVLVVFGANWCADCRGLERALRGGRNAELIAREFDLVKVNVGRFDRNLDIAKAYGDPIRKGIPAAVVLSADERVLYSTRAGELSNARRMSATGLHDFLTTVLQATRGAG